MDEAGVAETVAAIGALFEAGGAEDYIGEAVSQYEHAAQAALQAGDEGADAEAVLAAFLHDIGHLAAPRTPELDMAGLGTKGHERIGARWLLRHGFSARVAGLVKSHVEAKRYLVATDAAYAAALSPASRGTLEFQGGPMDDEEQRAFRAQPWHEDAVRLRRWDDLAKDPERACPPLEHFLGLCAEHLRAEQARREADARAKAAFDRDGYLHLAGALRGAELEDLRAWIAELASRPETPGRWMQYFEPGPAGQRQLCRIECFLEEHAELDHLLRRSEVGRMVDVLMGEPAVIFKEKLNLKLPGGAGFAPHQDAPAFTTFGQRFHITLMLAVDDATPDNGCLELIPGGHRDGQLPTAADGTIEPSHAETLPWQPLPVRAGDAVYFGSYLPHRSGPNQSQRSRRALYVTYNRLSEGGDVRAAYFRDKREVFPPDCERVPGRVYASSGVYNIGNPIRSGTD
ncbi:MAG: phytanoyl-CoA dioxygenase family protein [Deltaproteobacteria bacterium]|nr:phytanoyl-CoA dioxygenase family protein [Deltaproteobacteria bacterium]